MLVLDPLYAAVATRAGYADPWSDLPVTSALVMAVNMTVPMVLLMLRHRHGAVAIAEMAGAMIVPTAAAAGLHALGVLGPGQVMTVAHVAMFPAMLLVMLRRYRHYAT
jgi:flagellar biosynthetic protein FliP